QAPSTEEHMLGRQAKIVSPATLRRMLAYARQARQPKRDTVIVLLSAHPRLAPAAPDEPATRGWKGGVFAAVAAVFSSRRSDILRLTTEVRAADQGASRLPIRPRRRSQRTRVRPGNQARRGNLFK